MKKKIISILFIVMVFTSISCKKKTFKSTLLHYYRLIKAKKGIMVINLKNNSSFGYNQNKKFYMGSTMRLPLLAVLYHQAHKNRINLNQKIVVAFNDIAYGPGILKHVISRFDRRVFSLKDLAKIMMQSNDATATDLLIKAIKLENIKKALEEMNLSDIDINSDNTTITKKLFNLTEDKYKFYPPQMIKIEAEKKKDELLHKDTAFFINAYKDINTATPKALAKLLKLLSEKKLLPENFTNEILDIMYNSSSRKLLSFQMPFTTKTHNAASFSSKIMNDAGIVIDSKVNMVFVMMANFIRDDAALTLRRFIYISRLAYENYAKSVNN